MLNNFYTKYYSLQKSGSAVSRLGSFKLLFLAAFFMILLGFGLGINLDFAGIATNLVASHLLTLIAVSRFPFAKDGRSGKELVIAVFMPLFVISWLFGRSKKY